MDIMELVAKLTLDSSEYEKGLNGAEQDVSKWAGKAAMAAKGVGIAVAAVTTATAAAGGAFLKGAGQVAEYGDSVDKMSQKVGLSAEAYQKWDYVMKISGTEMSNMRTGLKTLTNKLDEAKNGSAGAQEMFAKLGLSMEELQGMSREEVFAATIKGFQGMADSTERAALANDLFGRSGQELAPLFNTSAEETEKLMKTVEECGGVMSDEAVKAAAAYEDSLTTLQTAMDGAKRNIMSSFLPSITSVMDGLSALFSGNGDEGIAKIREGVSSFIENMTEAIPKIFEFGGKIVTALGQAIIENLPRLLEAGIQAIAQIAKGLGDAMPELIPAVVEAILTMVQALLDNIDLLVDAALQLGIGIALGLIEALPVIVEKIPDIIVALVSALIKAIPAIAAAGVKLFSGLVKDLPKIIANTVFAVPKIVISLAKAFANAVPQMAQAGANLISGLWQGIRDRWNSVVSRLKSIHIKNLPKFVSAGGELIKSLANGMYTAFTSIPSNIASRASKIGDSIRQGTSNLYSIGKERILDLWYGIRDIFVQIPDLVRNYASSIPSKIKQGIGSLYNTGWNLIAGFWNGIRDKFDDTIDRVKSLARKLPKAVKKVLGIASPSKVFADIGQWIPEGLAKGIEDNLEPVRAATNAMVDGAAFGADGFEVEIDEGRGYSAGMNNTFNIYAQPGQDVQELAREVEKVLVRLQNQRKAAFA